MSSTLSHLTTLLVWPEVRLLVVYGAMDIGLAFLCTESVHPPGTWGLEQSGTLSASLRVYLQNSTVECVLS